MDDLGKSVVSYWRKGEVVQNFGDFISDFLARRLFYPYRSGVKAVHIVGSVIDDMFASSDDRPVVFWGCGLRGGRSPGEAFKQHAEIMAVRGPLSASALNAGALMPTGDPAFLLPALYEPERVDFLVERSVCIPHFHDSRSDNDLLGFAECDVVLRPNIENREESLLRMIDAICSAEFVLSASLHGCIVAAAYGRPFAYWNPDSVDLPFKWEDLSASLNIPCVFAANLREGRQIHQDRIAPAIRIPDLTRSVCSAPLLLRASGFMRVMAWQRRRADRGEIVQPAEALTAANDVEKRQVRIYDGIINELEYWSRRTSDAEIAVLSERESRESTKAENATLVLDQERLRGELAESVTGSAKLEKELQLYSARYEQKLSEFETIRAKHAETESELRTHKEEVMALQSQLSAEVACSSRFQADLLNALNEIRSFEDETARLRSRLSEEMARSSHHEADLANARRTQDERGILHNMQSDWMRLIQVQYMDAPWWWGLLPPAWRRSRMHARLKREGLFDAGTYLSRYPDVALNKMDPLRHYIMYGRAEGRQGGPTFPSGNSSASQSDVLERSVSQGSKKYPELPLDQGERRIVIVDGTYPTPDRDSGSVDAVNFVRIFRDIGYSVHFMATANFHNSELDKIAKSARADLEALGVHIVDDRYGPSIAEIIRMKGGYFDIFFLSRIYAGGVFFEDVRTHAPDSRIIFNTVDLHGVREMREGQLEGNRLKIMGAYRTTEREHYLARLADATIVVSAEEVKTLAGQVPGASVFEVPLLRDIPGTSADLDQRADLGFIGGYKHLPNIDAVRYFLDAIWPLIREKLPNARFHVMGADLPDELRERTDAGLVIVGQVENLQTAFDSLRLTVAPLRVGAGAKGKVVSSLCHGLPCVASPIAAEGMGLDGGVLVADSPEAFASEVARLYTDDALWRSLSKRGLALMERRYSIPAGTRLVKDILQAVGQSA